MMIQKLNLVDGLLARGRRFHEMGQLFQAAKILKKLVVFQQLPTQVAEEAQSRLADIRFRQGRFRRARRHLRAALAQQPNNADYHHRLALAMEEDPQADPLHALNHYRRSIRLDPKNPHYWCDFAYAAINAGQSEQGLKALRQANQLAPDDPEVLSLVVHALSSEGHNDEARDLLRAARFRHPRDFRFHGLWNRFQFDLLFERQQRRLVPRAKPEPSKTVILPFARKQDLRLGARTFRLDGPATLKGPSAKRTTRKRPSKK